MTEPQKVMLAIDWENIRRGAQMLRVTVSPQQITQALQQVGAVFGTVAGGKAFGDWSARPDDARAFTETEVTPYHAPRTLTGKDRADPSILIEVYDWLREDLCHTVVLASGDSDFQILVDRARAMERRIIVCAFSQSVSRDMLATAPLFPLEAELGIQLAEHGDVSPAASSTPSAPPTEQPAEDDLSHTFIRHMLDLESRMNFVGYSMLCNEWMLNWGIAWNEYECRLIVDDMINAGIAERHEVHNPNNPGYPTTALRLIRQHPKVEAAAGRNRGPISNPSAPR